MSSSAENTPATSPGTEAEPDLETENDAKLAKIKYLVDQSKLYARFLTENLEATPSNETLQFDKDCKTPNLHPHQKIAVKWILNLYQNGLNGILADEMGLGKTLSTIAFLSYLNSNNIEGPFLIVAPLSTVGNWVREVNTFTPHLECFGYYGTAQARKPLRKKLTDCKIVITSYEIVMADSRYLSKPQWKYIIVDEGHRLKNVNCKLMKQLKRFTSANRMLLTGTPLQNDLKELWALLNFLMPDVFTDIDIFHSWFEQGFAVDKNSESSLVASLHSILRPFVLRRIKSEVDLKLPNKREYVIYCGMEESQKDLYKHIIDGDAKEYILGLVKRSTKRQRTKTVDQVKYSLRNKSFNFMMMQLRQACNSPFLFYECESATAGVEIENTSGKLRLLWKLMQRLNGHKVLLFSQFTSMLDLVEEWADYREIPWCRIDGSTPQESRQEIMDHFNTNPEKQLFLLSTRSGGQGINLVAADTVVIFDSDWNPHQDLQAMDRVHRIGQDKPVLIFRFIVGDSVEQTLLERARSKLEFGNVVIEQAKLRGVGTQQEQIEEIGRQFEHHKVNFNDNVQLTDADFSKLLDRSPDAYAHPHVDNTNICVL